jgi:hypothetical protein
MLKDTNMKRYLVTQLHGDLVELEEVLFEFILFDYGSTKEDEEGLGEPCIALTREMDGGYPFIILPTRKVKEL